MVDHVNLALYLICHHGDGVEAGKDAEVIRRVSEKGVPITYFFSGIELNALDGDIVDIIKREFINPKTGYSNPYKPELGITPFHHIPLVQPWGQDLWGDYFEIFLKDEVEWSKDIAEQKFHKTPVTIHPPDGVYAPAVASVLKEVGLDTVVVSGEFLGENRNAKGITYWASGLRHLMRTNDIQPNFSRYSNAWHFVDEVEAYGHENDISFVTVGCDIDEFNGMRDLNIYDGIARLCCIGDEVARRQHISMINCNTAAYWNLHQTDIEVIWPWNDIHGMIHGNGDISWVDQGRNNFVNYMISLVLQRKNEGWDIGEAKNRLSAAMDIACRNRYFCDWLDEHFYGNMYVAKHLLQG